MCLMNDLLLAARGVKASNSFRREPQACASDVQGEPVHVDLPGDALFGGEDFQYRRLQLLACRIRAPRFGPCGIAEKELIPVHRQAVEPGPFALIAGIETTNRLEWS
jgi:hypothetical protein